METAVRRGLGPLPLSEKEERDMVQGVAAGHVGILVHRLHSVAEVERVDLVQLRWQEMAPIHLYGTVLEVATIPPEVMAHQGQSGFSGCHHEGISDIERVMPQGVSRIQKC